MAKDKVEIKISADDRCINKWQTGHTNAYNAPGSAFTKDLGAPNTKGTCRYSFQGFRDDENVSSIECLKVNGFNWIYLPLACLNKP